MNTYIMNNINTSNVDEISLTKLDAELNEEELNILADRLLKIVHTLRLLLIGFKVRRSIERVVAWRLLLKLYRYIIDVLAILDKEKLTRYGKDNIAEFIKNINELTEKVNELVSLSEPIVLDLEQYLPAFIRLALSTCERVKEILRKKSRIPPEVDAILLELKRIVQTYYSGRILPDILYQP